MRKVDDYTIDMETNGANPLLINNLRSVYEAEAGAAPQVAGKQPLSQNQTEHAFMLISRVPDEEF